MDWSDILVKIGVGACLGFGIITLAKLFVKKNMQQQKNGQAELSDQQGAADSDDVEKNR